MSATFCAGHVFSSTKNSVLTLAEKQSFHSLAVVTRIRSKVSLLSLKNV